MKLRISAVIAGLWLLGLFAVHAAAPTDIHLSANTVLEWAPANTVVGTLSAVDADAGDGHLFSLVTGTGSDHNNGFLISGNQLITQYEVNRDFETTALTMSVRVRVTDSSWQTYEKVFSIVMTDDRNEDADHDGLTEAREEDVYGTSDVVYDSDGDGVGDGVEVAANTPPNNASQWPATSLVGWGSSSEGEQAAPVSSGLLALNTGENHSLALTTGGQVSAWGGLGTFGQLAVPSGLGNVVAVAAGGDFWLEDSAHSLALRNDGTVRAWGYDHLGQIVVPSGLAQVAAISAGRTHCLALKSDGTVIAWGYNPNGGIQPPAGLAGVVAIAAGGYHSLALKNNGTVVEWGSNFDGARWRNATVPAGLCDVVAISAGRFHSLALKSDGKVIAWGYNSNGQTDVPAGLSNVVAISAGGFHNLALKSDGSVAAWGSDSHGQCSVPPAAMSGVKAISAGILHSLAVLQEASYPVISSSPQILGTPGAPISHQIVVTNATPAAYKVLGLPAGLAVDPLTGVISGSTGPARCAVSIQVETDQGLLSQSAWVGVSEGQPPESISITPAVVAENSPAGTVVGFLSATDPDAGDTHTFELVDGGGSGDNAGFRISGNQLIADQAVTRDFEANPAGFSVRIRARDASLNPCEQVLALQFQDDLTEDADGDGLTEAQEAAHLISDADADSDDDGFGDYYEVTAGTQPNQAISFPTGRLLVAWGSGDSGQTTPPPGMENVVAVSAGGVHNLALRNDGTVSAWGGNDDGQAAVPEGLTGVTAVEAGDKHSLVLKNDGTVTAWGDNDYGQCDVPEGLAGVVAISAGAMHNLALKDDGTVAAWGYNAYFQSEVPAGLTNVVAVAAGGFHSMALKSDGTVVVWGSDWDGVSTVPVGLSGVVAIAAGGYHCLALRYDGSVVAWGSDGEGQTDIPAGLSGVTSISAGWLHSLALKSNGTLTAWGDNAGGQSAIPLEAASIRLIDAGESHNLAIRQQTGFPAFADPTPVRSWPGETVSRTMTVLNALATAYSAMGLPEDLTIHPASGLVSGVVSAGTRRAVRIAALTDQLVLSRVVWISTADGAAPTDITLSGSTVMENAPAGTLVGELTVTDPNAGDTHTLDLVYVAGAPDSFRFMIVGNQLIARYPVGADFDSGATQLLIRVIATDSGNNTLEKNFSLSLTDDRGEDADGDHLSEAFEEDVLGTSDANAVDAITSDADVDGVPGILEYAFNLNPKAAGPPLRLTANAGSTAGLPAVDLVTDGTGHAHLRLEYIRRIGGFLTYTPQFSSGLAAADWQGATSTVTVSPIDSSWERCVVEDAQSTSVSVRRFARVAVTW